jgi:hypothetical protein
VQLAKDIAIAALVIACVLPLVALVAGVAGYRLARRAADAAAHASPAAAAALARSRPGDAPSSKVGARWGPARGGGARAARSLGARGGQGSPHRPEGAFPGNACLKLTSQNGAGN